MANISRRANSPFSKTCLPISKWKLIGSAQAPSWNASSFKLVPCGAIRGGVDWPRQQAILEALGPGSRVTVHFLIIFFPITGQETWWFPPPANLNRAHISSLAHWSGWVLWLIFLFAAWNTSSKKCGEYGNQIWLAESYSLPSLLLFRSSLK